MEVKTFTSGTYMFFVTENAEHAQMGTNGSHYACRFLWSDSSLTSFTSGSCFNRNYNDLKWKYNAAIMVKSATTMYGVAAGHE